MMHSLELLKDFGQLKNQTDAWVRTARPAHFTASAFVFDPRLQAVLLIQHKKLKKWLQPGGHCDGNTDFIEVAQKELFEETGLVLAPFLADPFDLDIHSIPESDRESAHLHYDWRVLFVGDSSHELPQNQEGTLVKWVSLANILEFTTEESILRMVHKAKTLRFL